jgi:hypothetical protein
MPIRRDDTRSRVEYNEAYGEIVSELDLKFPEVDEYSGAQKGRYGYNGCVSRKPLKGRESNVRGRNGMETCDNKPDGVH